MSTLTGVTRNGDGYDLQFTNRTVTVTLADLRKALGKNVSTAVLETRINTWLETNAQLSGCVIAVHIFNETPPYFKVGIFQKANLTNGLPLNWWVEDNP